ncbi:MAG TPA: hypothetical protein VEI81_03075 [Methanoregula sp.]|nr:hypothetical protein [Methanoregula sp.]
MVNKGWQLQMKRTVERLFRDSCHRPVRAIEKTLSPLGFRETGADPVAIAFENPAMELYLEIELEGARCVHSYLLVTFEEKNQRRRKFRW